MADYKYYLLLKKLEKKFIKYSLVFSFLFITIATSIIYQLQEFRLFNYTDKISQNMKTALKLSQKNIIDKYSLTLTRIINDENVITLFKNENREKLYKKMKKEFAYIKIDNIDINALHFHNPDGTSFLRVHKPEKHSDLLSEIRPMIKYMHNTHKKLSSYETGRNNISYRLLQPVFDYNEYIGAIEIGVHPDFMSTYLEKTLGQKSFFFINEKKSRSSTVDLKIGNMVVEYIDYDYLELLSAIPKDYDFKKFINIEYKNKQYFLGYVDIYDFKNVLLGKEVYLKDISSFRNENQAIFIFVLIILFITFSIGVYVVKHYIKHYEKTLNNFFTKLVNEEKNQKNYLQAMENSSSNFTITNNGKELLSMNKSALEFFGFTDIEKFKKEHKCISDFFIDKSGFLSVFVGELDWIQYIFTNKTLTHKVLMKKDDIFYTFLINVQVFTDNKNKIYMITLTDISELETLHGKFQYIIKRNTFAETGSNMAIWDWNLKNDKVFYSNTWKALLGYTTDEISDSLNEWHNIIHPDDIKNVIADLDLHFIKDTKYFQNKHRLLHKNGDYIYIMCRGQVIYEDDIPVRMVGIYTDITNEQKSANKIKEQEELMIAQSRHAAMGEMISMIAHQWRQPISSIAMGCNNMLLDIELDNLNSKDARIECNEILDQTKYLSNTIDDFRSFFKEDKEIIEVCVEEVVDDALRLMQKSFDNNDIAISLTYCHTIKIKTLPREILQILINLFKNAKEVLVEKIIDDKFIKINTREDEKYVYIDIQDNGGGIEEENILKIFQPYFTTKDEHNGTGLGLYMSKTLAQKHLSGNLSVQNVQGGAKFTLSIKKT